MRVIKTYEWCIVEHKSKMPKNDRPFFLDKQFINKTLYYAFQPDTFSGPLWKYLHTTKCSSENRICTLLLFGVKWCNLRKMLLHLPSKTWTVISPGLVLDGLQTYLPESEGWAFRIKSELTIEGVLGAGLDCWTISLLPSITWTTELAEAWDSGRPGRLMTSCKEMTKASKHMCQCWRKLLATDDERIQSYDNFVSFLMWK